MERLIVFLMPYFLTITQDFDLARTEILETLASYGARTRSEMLNAAQIIAFGFSALDTLAEAKATEMSPSMRLRFRGCANNLNRSGQQHEHTLAKRLACDVPDHADLTSDPVDDMPDTEFEQALQQVQAEIATYRNRLSTAQPATTPNQAKPGAARDDKNRLWGTMISNLAEMGLPVPTTAAPERDRAGRNVQGA